MGHNSPHIYSPDLTTIGSMPGFRSFKTKGAIVYGQRWHRDVLIQLTLNFEMRLLQIGSQDYRREILELIALTRTGEIKILAYRDEHEKYLNQKAQNRTLIRRSDILADPHATNARMIWSMRRKPVSPADRLRVLMRLEECPEGLPLAKLLLCVRSSPVEPIEVLFALVCQGQLLIDYVHPIGPSTILRSSIKADSLI